MHKQPYRKARRGGLGVGGGGAKEMLRRGGRLWSEGGAGPEVVTLTLLEHTGSAAAVPSDALAPVAMVAGVGGAIVLYVPRHVPKRRPLAKCGGRYLSKRAIL